MPNLLEVIAENDTAVLKGWAAVFTESAPRIHALSEREQRRERSILAREINRHTVWAAETAEDWLLRLKSGLEEGINGHELRILYRSGKTLCRIGLTIVEVAVEAWRLAGGTSLTPEGATLLDQVGVARQRIVAVEIEFNAFTSIAERKPPQIAPELIEKGKEQIEQGKWLTPEQARAGFLKSE